MTQVRGSIGPAASAGARAGRVTAAVLAATLLSTVGVACGDPGTDPTEKAEATVATLLHTCARGDGEAALHLLTPPARAELFEADSVVTGCDRLIGFGVESEVQALTVFGEAVVDTVEVDGGFGTATVRSPGGTTSELELESAGDQWLVTNPPS